MPNQKVTSTKQYISQYNSLAIKSEVERHLFPLHHGIKELFCKKLEDGQYDGRDANAAAESLKFHSSVGVHKRAFI